MSWLTAQPRHRVTYFRHSLKLFLQFGMSKSIRFGSYYQIDIIKFESIKPIVLQESTKLTMCIETDKINSNGANWWCFSLIIYIYKTKLTDLHIVFFVFVCSFCIGNIYLCIYFKSFDWVSVLKRNSKKNLVCCMCQSGIKLIFTTWDILSVWMMLGCI